MNKYSREIRPGVWVDVYDVLAAFRTGCPALDHAVKKLLAPGQRGAKSREQDLEEAILSVRRSIEILATGRESGSGNAPGPEGGSTPDPAPSCTGLAAVWCPVHGDCTCERSHEYAEDDPVDTACPLHGQASDHAANEHCPDPAPRRLARSAQSCGPSTVSSSMPAGATR